MPWTRTTGRGWASVGLQDQSLAPGAGTLGSRIGTPCVTDERLSGAADAVAVQAARPSTTARARRRWFLMMDMVGLGIEGGQGERGRLDADQAAARGRGPQHAEGRPVAAPRVSAWLVGLVGA